MRCMKLIPTIKTNQKDDKFFQLVGELGPWQLKVFATIFLVKLSSGWVQMAMLFLTPKFSFWCSSKENAENNTCYEDCLEYEYDTEPFGKTIVSEWDLVCERKWLASFTQMMLQLGILIGSVVFGFLSDRFGRKNTFLASILLLIGFSFGIPFSPTYTVFTILRFGQGLSVAGTMIVSFVIVMESIGPRFRELFGCVFHYPFAMGHVTTPLFAYYLRDWNTYMLGLAAPSIIFLGYLFIVNESPRWLISVGRLDEATKAVEYISDFNNLPKNDIRETINLMSNEIQNKKLKERRVNYLDLVNSRSLAVKTISSCILWFITGMTFYGVNQYISLTSPNPFISVAAAGAIQFPSDVLAIWFIRRFGRKYTTICGLWAGGICVIIIGFTSHVFWLTLVLSTLGISCLALVSVTVYIYSSELFPTVVRNMGVGVSSMSMRVGSMIAPFVASLSSEVWVPAMIFGLGAVLFSSVCFLLPETKGRKLPDSLEDG